MARVSYVAGALDVTRFRVPRRLDTFLANFTAPRPPELRLCASDTRNDAPLLDAAARVHRVELSAMNPTGHLCAWTMLAAESDAVTNSSTLPDCAFWVDSAVEKGVVGGVAAVRRGGEGADGSRRGCQSLAMVSVWVARLTVGARARLDFVVQFHVGNVVYVPLLFNDDDQSPSLQLDGENRRWERRLADRRLGLPGVGRVSFGFLTFWKSRLTVPWC